LGGALSLPANHFPTLGNAGQDSSNAADVAGWSCQLHRPPFWQRRHWGWSKVDVIDRLKNLNLPRGQIEQPGKGFDGRPVHGLWAAESARCAPPQPEIGPPEIAQRLRERRHPEFGLDLGDGLGDLRCLLLALVTLQPRRQGLVPCTAGAFDLGEVEVALGVGRQGFAEPFVKSFSSRRKVLA